LLADLRLSYTRRIAATQTPALALIHSTSWKKNSANFAFWGFSEVGLPLYGVLSTLPNKLCEVHTHRLSQSVLRIGSQSVLFSGLGDCPNKIILSFPSPEKGAYLY
jgi:hypothetical protein